MKYSSVLLATAASLAAAAVCRFEFNDLQCPQQGQTCCADTNFVADSGSRAGGANYIPAFCQVTAGHNETTWCGTVQTTPTFDANYNGPCGSGLQYQCQYDDPTTFGEEPYPGVMSCHNNKCVMDQLQETGDPCSSNFECASDVCVNGVCHGNPVNAPCYLGGCANGLYCKITAGDSGTCQYQAPIDSQCYSLSQCPSGTICNLASTPAYCKRLWSQPAGALVNTADLCASGFIDENRRCVDQAPASALLQPCNCGSTPNTPGVACSCTVTDMCYTHEHTKRTPNMVLTRKAARSCYANTFAPDGTRCNDPLTNLGSGPRPSIVGTCGYLKCHRETLAMYAAEAEANTGQYAKFNKDSPCAQLVEQAFYSAASRNMVPCALPGAWRSLGWTCNTEPPAADAGMSGGAKFGIAVAVLLPLGLIGYAGWALKTGRAPQWLSNAASTVSSKFSRAGSYTKVGVPSSSMASAYIYTSSAGTGSKTPLAGSYGAA